MSNARGSAHSSEARDNEEEEQIDDNIIQILVASDINLGYEQTVKRGQEGDSFRTFEEILKYARDYDVDAILLTGNLFYESNPPLNVITKCISLLRTYCLTQKSVKIDCLTDPEWIFNHCPHKIVNFKDPNLNIGMPIFSIYGHRDTPIFGPSGALDLIAATGLINYFGNWQNKTKISIPPLLLRKGVSTLALYGLNYMNDEKLSKIIKNDKFELLQDHSLSEICKVLILHQKRARPGRTENMFVSESLLPDFLNLIIWGHEPVPRIAHEPYPDKTFRISQPGSCIATSLTRGETVPKKVGILKTFKDGFKMKYLKLKTVRPFVFDKLYINQHSNELTDLQCQLAHGQLILKSRTEAIEELVDNYIQKTLLPKASRRESGHPQQPKKPLVRLKVFYDEDGDCFNLFRLSRKYEDKIANSNDMIVFLNKSLEVNDLDGVNDDDNDYEELSEILFADKRGDWKRTIEGGITELFSRDENRSKLRVLSLNSLNNALTLFKNRDHQAFDRTVRKQIQETVDHLMSIDVESDDDVEIIENSQDIKLELDCEESK